LGSDALPERFGAARVDGKPIDLGDRSDPVIELRTRAGELKIVPQPAGTRSYDDLRWHAGTEGDAFPHLA
jgi:hypothetical protein